jgi:homoserine dehydrogenase
MKRMIVAFGICTVLSSSLNAQDLSAPKDRSELKLTVSDTSLALTFRDKIRPVVNIAGLENYLKNISETLSPAFAVIESNEQLSPEKYREIVKMLRKYGVQNIRGVCYDFK